MEGMAAQHRASSPRRAQLAAPQLRKRSLRLGKQEAQPAPLRRPPRPHRSLLPGALLLVPLLTPRQWRRP